MVRVQKGDKVSLHYRARLEDGTIYDDTRNRGPITFTQGAGHVLPALDRAVLGMGVGEAKIVRVSEEELYGYHDPALVVQLDRAEFDKRGIHPEIGLTLEINMGMDQPGTIRVTDISNSTVTLDANHPLAGQSVNFELHLYSLR